MQGNRKAGTRPELALVKALREFGVPVQANAAVLADGLRVVVDIVIDKPRIAVFVDGCFWHSCPEHGVQPKRNTTYWEAKLSKNRRRDDLVNRTLRAAGWTVERFWEHEIRDPLNPRVNSLSALGKDLARI